ncbi:MAG: NAD-dependent epimerase/dehydratase family protein [Candidatus Dormibacteria bacterium]
MSLQRALITGGAGFIGSHLSDLLVNSGYEVTALDDLSTGSMDNIRDLLDNPRFRFRKGSVLHQSAVEEEVGAADVVFHLAAAVGVRLIVEHPLESFTTNTKGTENVLAAALKHRRKVVIASTSEIYGKSQNGPFKEDDDRVLGSTRKPRWSYSTSKAVDEILAFAYHRELGLPTIVVRLFNTIGPRQVGQYGMVVPRFISQALRSEPLTVYGDGTQSRSFTAVHDAVKAITMLAQTPQAEGDVFNIAGGEEISIERLAELVIARTKSSSTIRHVPFEEVYGPDFEDMARRAADTSKLQGVTGFRCETRLVDTVDAMIRSAREAMGQS